MHTFLFFILICFVSDLSAFWPPLNETGIAAVEHCDNRMSHKGGLTGKRSKDCFSSSFCVLLFISLKTGGPVGVQPYGWMKSEVKLWCKIVLSRRRRRRKVFVFVFCFLKFWPDFCRVSFILARFQLCFFCFSQIWCKIVLCRRRRRRRKNIYIYFLNSRQIFAVSLILDRFQLCFFCFSQILAVFRLF